MIRKSVALAAILVLVPALALAGGSPRAHDGGFMLRMAAGFGGGVTSYSGEEIPKFEGPQGDLSVAIGGMVSENLALHGTLFGFSMADPDLTAYDLFDNLRTGEVNGTVTMGAIGGGVTWWVMPVNLYVSASMGIGTISFDPDFGPSGETDAGFAMEFTAGKEWFVSDHWGLGLAGGLTWHNIPDGGDQFADDWSGASFSLRFSATFN